MTACLEVALRIAFASEWRTDPAHAERKKTKQKKKKHKKPICSMIKILTLILGFLLVSR